jgi:hypothetical protein
MKTACGVKKSREEDTMLKLIFVRLTDELLRPAKIAAIARDTTLQGLVTEALEAHLKKGVRR